MIESRLGALETEARMVVRAASIYGQDFASAGVAALLGDAMKPDDVEQWSGWLSERDVFDRRGAGRWSFRHALVRDAAYGMLTEEDRLLGHRLAGHWLAAVGEKDAVVVATHFERSDDTAQAAQWLSRAASQALEGSDFSGAVAFAERALASITDPRQRGELLVVQAEAHRWRGAYDDVRRCAQEAMRALDPGAPKWFRAAAEVATAMGVQGDGPGLEEVANALAKTPNGPNAEAAASIAFARTALQLIVRGRLEVADELLARAESFASDEPLAQARILQTRAARADIVGEGHEHVRHTRACVAAFQRAGDERNACVQRSNLGYGLLELGLHAEAAKELATALTSAQTMGLVTAEAAILHLQGIAALRAGRTELAIGLGDRAAAIFAAQGSTRMEGGVRAVEAQARLAKGDLDGALTSAERAEELLRDRPPARPYAMAILARVHLARGDVATALPLAERAAQSLDELGAIDAGEALVRLTLVDARDAAGDPRALQALRAAKTRLLERASRIDDLALRESFLGHVPDNARTMALAKERDA
jgi:tetratricopeptide (TPR) repeat protein